MIAVIITTILCTLILSVCIGISIWAIATIFVRDRKQLSGPCTVTYGGVPITVLPSGSWNQVELQMAYERQPEWRYPTDEEIDNLKKDYALAE